MNHIRFWNFNSHVEFEMRAWNASCLRFWFRNGNYASITTKACCHIYSRLWKLSDINFWKLICNEETKKMNYTHLPKQSSPRNNIMVCLRILKPFNWCSSCRAPHSMSRVWVSVQKGFELQPETNKCKQFLYTV